MRVNLKLQYFVQLMQILNSLEKPDVGKNWGQQSFGERRRTTEDEMVGWLH